MTIFNLFRKEDPEKVYEQIGHGIVMSSLQYRQEIETSNERYSADAGAEIAYFLLHMFDKQLFEQVGPKARDKIFDKVAIKVLGDYARAVLKPETPIEIVLQLGKSMLDTLNERQRIYSKCQCLVRKDFPFPSRGTTVFALSFYIHKALRKTSRDDVDEILCGKRDIDNSELEHFPDYRDILKVYVYGDCSIFTEFLSIPLFASGPFCCDATPLLSNLA